MGFHVSKRAFCRRSRRMFGFTLPEVVIAGAVLALFAASSVATMALLNRWAAAARLRTLALALAQQRTDDILTTSWSVRDTRPTLLATGTATETALPLNNDTFNSATGLSSAFTNLDTPVTATRTTVVTDVSNRLIRANVTVSFTYRNRTQTVQLTTMRTTDDF